jgi:phosphoribosyl-ATP pyrophosphohydrolase/phosphoribosyl-AMP cyclohydrolase
MIAPEKIRFDRDGLVPAVIQDEAGGTVLMLAYMNAESLAKTLETGYTWFYSRSRQKLWNKGETSGNVQEVKGIYYDCDGDTLLVKVKQTGAACHEGTFSCFSRALTEASAPVAQPDSFPAAEGALAGILEQLYALIEDRKANPQEGSYTNYLFDKGQDKILKKVGEEAAETIIASKNGSTAEVLYEMADLWYHCLVLLAYHNIRPQDLLAELAGRRK